MGKGKEMERNGDRGGEGEVVVVLAEMKGGREKERRKKIRREERREGRREGGREGGKVKKEGKAEERGGRGVGTKVERLMHGYVQIQLCTASTYLSLHTGCNVVGTS